MTDANECIKISNTVIISPIHTVLAAMRAGWVEWPDSNEIQRLNAD